MILARPEDPGAMWLAKRWQSRGAAMVTPADLSSSGWSLRVGAARRSTLCFGGRNVSSDELDGVLTRISCVQENDLHHIVPSDRQYIASEMTAFLLSWLSSLTVPVSNRPTPGSLAGPGWRAEEWTYLAARLGIAVQTMLRKAPNGWKPIDRKSASEVTVVGRRCFGDADSLLIKSAQALAKASGTDLLSVKFNGAGADSAFLNASPWPDLASPEIADAALDHLLEKRKC